MFTHHIVPGGADRSYGIHVAQMAGLPPTVTRAPRKSCSDLEDAAQRVPTGGGGRSSPVRVITVRQLGLFAATHPVIEELNKLDISTMSPLEAINKLYELQKGAGLPGAAGLPKLQ